MRWTGTSVVHARRRRSACGRRIALSSGFSGAGEDKGEVRSAGRRAPGRVVRGGPSIPGRSRAARREWRSSRGAFVRGGPFCGLPLRRRCALRVLLPLTARRRAVRRRASRGRVGGCRPSARFVRGRPARTGARSGGARGCGVTVLDRGRGIVGSGETGQRRAVGAGARVGARSHGGDGRGQRRRTECSASHRVSSRPARARYSPRR